MTFVIARFDPDEIYPGYGRFDCGHPQINKFVKDSLKKQVRQGLSVAYVLLEEGGATGPGRFVGFYTIANHSIPLSALSVLQLGSLPRTIPCVRLIMLGIHRDDAGKGHGRQFLNHAFDVTKEGARNIGSFGMYLDADAGAVAFYLKLGFRLLDGDKSPEPSPMFMPLSALP